MSILGYLYICIISVYVIKYAHKGTLFIFSPLLVYADLIFSDLLPLYLPQEKTIPPIMYVNTHIAMIVNLIFLFYYRKLYLKKINVSISYFQYYKREKIRYILLVLFILIYIISGIVSGTLTGLLRGEDMEDMRRTGEIGVGFLRDIPAVGCEFLLLLIFIKYKWKKFILAGVVLLSVGLTFLVCSGGNRGILLSFATIFLCYMAICYRGLKFYEYLAWKLGFNIIGAILNAIRQAETFTYYLLNFTWADAVCGYQNIVFNNSITLINVTKKYGFFYGQETLTNFTYFIPRFIWPEKPVSFGYKMKELAGYSFPGGGIMPSTIEYSYINWGNLWVVDYILWLIFLNYLYAKLIKIKDYKIKLFIILLLISVSYWAHVAKELEVLLLLWIFLKFIYLIISPQNVLKVWKNLHIIIYPQIVFKVWKKRQ